MEVGWLGVGAMGLPMAQRLIDVHSLCAFDPTASRVGEISDTTRAAASPAEAASGCEVLILAVASAHQAEEALFGPSGAADALSAQARLVVLSTLGPQWVRQAAVRLAPVRVVDAPVSGGTIRAAQGSLLVMAAGVDPQTRALLELLGEVVVVGDEPGLGQAMKMVNQVLCGVHIAAAAEALALADALGFDPALAWDVVCRGAGSSFMLEDRGARMVAGSAHTVRSALALFVKDLALVRQEAAAAGQPTPLSDAAAAVFDGAAAGGRGRHDDAEVYNFLRGLRDPGQT